jgi:hypothetical protein
MYRPPKYADLYITEIVKLHGIPKTIMSDRGPHFTAHFWEWMHKSLGTSLVRSKHMTLKPRARLKDSIKS